MAARLNPQHDALTRDKIRTSQLINRLNAFALEENDPQSDKPVKLSRDQIRAIEILLKKTLPDLTATELTGADGGPVEIKATSNRDRAKALAAVLTAAKKPDGPSE